MTFLTFFVILLIKYTFYHSGQKRLLGYALMKNKGGVDWLCLFVAAYYPLLFNKKRNHDTEDYNLSFPHIDGQP
jgi:hypothetical protein